MKVCELKVSEAHNARITRLSGHQCSGICKGYKGNYYSQSRCFAGTILIVTRESTVWTFPSWTEIAWNVVMTREWSSLAPETGPDDVVSSASSRMLTFIVQFIQ